MLCLRDSIFSHFDPEIKLIKPNIAIIILLSLLKQSILRYKLIVTLYIKDQSWLKSNDQYIHIPSILRPSLAHRSYRINLLNCM